MKRIGKPIFFIVAAFILIFTTVAFTGISSTYGDITKTYVKGVGDIRWGIDIRGGVDVTFTPSTDVTPTELQMEAAAETMKQRLVSLNITDYEVYTDTQRDVLSSASRGKRARWNLIRRPQLKSLAKPRF